MGWARPAQELGEPQALSVHTLMETEGAQSKPDASRKKRTGEDLEEMKVLQNSA